MCGAITKVLKAFMGNDTSDAVCRVLSANKLLIMMYHLEQNERWREHSQDMKMHLTVETHQKGNKNKEIVI